MRGQCSPSERKKASKRHFGTVKRINKNAGVDKRKKHHVNLDGSLVHVGDVVDQLLFDEVLSTDTSIASSLTRRAVAKLQLQNAAAWNLGRNPRSALNKRRLGGGGGKRRRSLLEYSVYRRMELLDELIVCLGQCYPRWKHRRFGLQRFYCHKFNIHLNLISSQNYARLLSTLWDGFESSGVDRWSSSNIWLQLLTQEYQIDSGKQNNADVNREYSNNKRVEEVLQQLDEISSCFCSDKCAMDFMRHSSYWGTYRRTTIVQENDIVKDIIGDCFAFIDNIKKSEHARDIPAIVSFYKERGIIHNFTRPYEYGVQVTAIEGFKRSVVCLSCGRICWCRCQRKLFRTQRVVKSAVEGVCDPSSYRTTESDVTTVGYVVGEACDVTEGDDEEEITDMHEFVNSLHPKKQTLHPNIARTAITVSHSKNLECGVLHCYARDVEGSFDSDIMPVELKHKLLRASIVRGGVDDLFTAILPRANDFNVDSLTNEVLEKWKSVPSYRSWRYCWWRLIDVCSIDTSDISIKPYVERTLERLDALGNVRYNLDYGYISVGYLQRRNRLCAYWRHFYVSRLGLWRAFTKAAEYNIMICTIPSEIQLDSRSMHWTVCKCHQGEMYRKSFSALKRGLMCAYILALGWFETLLRDLNVSTVSYPDLVEESDDGCDMFDDALFLKKGVGLYECPVTVEQSYIASRKRKLVLCDEKRFDLLGGSDGSSRVVCGGGVKEQHLLQHNLFASELRPLFPGVDKDKSVNADVGHGQTLRNLLTQYPELKDYFNLSIKYLEECVYTLKIYVSNAINKGCVDLIEPLLQLTEDKRLADVIPQVPMQWVSFHKSLDSWTCVLECYPCITCAPSSCLKQPCCVKFKSGKEVISLLCKKFSPCSFEYSDHPFNKDSSVSSCAISDGYCIVGFNTQKFGYNGAKALATEFRKRYIQLVYASMKYDGSFNDALLGMIAEEIGLLTSTDAYILPNSTKLDERKSVLSELTCGVCSSFGETLQHRSGPVFLKQLFNSSVQGKRLCEVFGLGQMAEGVLSDVNLDIKFCSVHMSWVVWWQDCMKQNRVMFYRVEDLIDSFNLVEALETLDRHWTAAIYAHVEHSTRNMGDRYQLTLLCRFEEAFHHFTVLQKNLYEAFHTSFAMALRSIIDSKQEFKLLKRLWQLNKNEVGDVLSEDVNGQSFALTDTVVFPFGSLHDEGTPPLSDGA
ncbi:uncharacterized protein BXIN_1328 [Babesia sp. Xinjiang]|uniref:uncharacterized protein n=1 Tax=Babesia sp. Xinjiang TaxID=462227 RepID=UPI000A21636E|nr:uncharacterized protein BXIN_1328 [Babesia sp. Xinjiang]ORM40096.1 hypothetical protein BXIN_1328 [Babesia sp. Xinjiang]